MKKKVTFFFILILISSSIMATGCQKLNEYFYPAAAKEIVFAESGKVIYWPMVNKSQPAFGRFVMDNETYVVTSNRNSTNGRRFTFDYSKDRLLEPVANIEFDPAYFHPVNNFLWKLSTGKTYYEIEIVTLYPIENEHGFRLYYGENSRGDSDYIHEDDDLAMVDYYSNIENYDTQNVLCRYSVYTDEDVYTSRGGNPFTTIKTEMVIDPEVFIALEDICYGNTDIEKIEYSQKYRDIDDAAVPGTPIFGYEERELRVFSVDNMAYKRHTLGYLEDRIYIIMGSSGGYISVLPIPDEIHDQLLATVFADKR